MRRGSGYTPQTQGEAVAICLFLSVVFFVVGFLTGGLFLLALPLVWLKLAFDLKRLSTWPGNIANQTFVGPRGGRYRINSNGRKVYDV